MNVIDHLMSIRPLFCRILYCSLRSDGNLLGYGKQFSEVLIWDIVQLCAVVLWDDECVAFRDRSDVYNRTAK